MRSRRASSALSCGTALCSSGATNLNPTEPSAASRSRRVSVTSGLQTTPDATGSMGAFGGGGENVGNVVGCKLGAKVGAARMVAVPAALELVG